MLVGEYLDQYIDAFVKPFRAPNTVGCYRRAFQSLPVTVYGTDLQLLTGLQLQAAIKALTE